MPLLQELEQKIVKKDIGLLESDWFHLARANDVGGMRFLLINYPGVLNNRDSTGQTALHWGAKRNYYDMCWELVNLKCDVFLQDYVYLPTTVGWPHRASTSREVRQLQDRQVDSV